MKIRKWAVGLTVAAMSLAGVAQAQDTCFGLSASDCAAIASATENTLSTVMSFNQTWSIDFRVSGIPDSGDITFNATGSGPVILDLMGAFPLSFDQSITASFSDGLSSGGGMTGAILKDGILYVDMGDGMWGSLNLLSALESGEVGGQELPLDLDALASGDVDPEAALGALEAFGDLAAIPGFLTYTRMGDTFTFVADLTRLINDPSFQNGVSSLAMTAGEDGAQIAGLVSLLPMLLSEGRIEVVQQIDSSANIVTGIGFNVNATIDSAMLTGSDTPITITLFFRVDLSEPNGSFDIQAPDNVTPLDGAMGM
ncbi:hypothetical protein VZO05_15095 [Aggregatilineales bacterium SYSU G02658]